MLHVCAALLTPGCVVGSQKGQDKWVLQHASTSYRSEDHYYVDLAANDPVCLSNTVALEKRKWKGVCIEANAALAASLRQRRNCAVIEAPISSTPGEQISFASHLGHNGGIIKEGMDNERVHNGTRGVVTMKTRRLDEVLRAVGAPRRISYLSLDVEGAEDEALCADFPFDEFIFELISIERPPPWLNARLFRHGYLYVKNDDLNHYDSYYVHPSHPNSSSLERNSSFAQVPASCKGFRRMIAHNRHECVWEVKKNQ